MNILIVGAGEVGLHLAKKLSPEKHDITLLEIDPEKARYAEEHLDAMVKVGSGSSLEDLRMSLGFNIDSILKSLTLLIKTRRVIKKGKYFLIND